jgi:chemotaxis protein MotB
LKRHSRPSTEDHGGGDNYLASVSDLMSGLMYLFIITLTILAVRVGQARKELMSTKDTRDSVLVTLQGALRRRGLTVAIDTDAGVLRLPERVVFPTGSATLEARERDNVDKLSDAIADVVPQYVGVRRGRLPQIESILIEGHTDPRRISRPFKDNLELSTARAREVFLAITATRPLLDTLQNREGIRVLAMSGYGDRRMIDNGASEVAWQRNRRIDLRFIMMPPQEAPAGMGAADSIATQVRGRFDR